MVDPHFDENVNRFQFCQEGNDSCTGSVSKLSFVEIRFNLVEVSGNWESENGIICLKGVYSCSDGLYFLYNLWNGGLIFSRN